MLSKNFVALPKLQILAAACYWVARKIQGKTTTAKILVKAANNAFTIKDLELAERAVVMKLINKVINSPAALRVPNLFFVEIITMIFSSLK